MSTTDFVPKQEFALTPFEPESLPTTLGLGIRSSTSIGKLAEALAKAQGNFGKVVKDSANPYFKSNYADLATVLEAVRKHLSDQGIAVIQSPRSQLMEGQRCMIITTALLHSSGEWMADDLAIPMDKAFTAQTVGSAVTYGRRYALQAFLGVAGEDDDGNAASGKKVEPKPHEAETDAEFDQRTAGQRCIDVSEIQAIDEAIKRTGKTEDEVIAALGFIGEKRIEHIKKASYEKFLKWCNSTKKQAADTNKAMKALFGTAGKFGIPESDVKRASYEKFHVQSMTELNAAQLEEMTQWVKEVAESVAQS